VKPTTFDLPHNRSSALFDGKGGFSARFKESIDLWSTALLNDDGIIQPIKGDTSHVNSKIIVKQKGIFAGRGLIDRICKYWAPQLELNWNFTDGDSVSKGDILVEIIGDKKGFWLKPHKDIPEKLMTMMIWANPYQESENLGTDLYDKDFKLVKTIKYLHNNGYFFSSGEDTWHGLELKEIKKERRCIQINYVSFKTDWPVEN